MKSILDPDTTFHWVTIMLSSERSILVKYQGLDHFLTKNENTLTKYLCRLPAGCDLWDLYLNVAQRRLEPWVRITPTYKYDPQTPFFEMLVPTVDTVRFGYIMEKLLAISQPVLFTGITGIRGFVVICTLMFATL